MTSMRIVVVSDGIVTRGLSSSVNNFGDFRSASFDIARRPKPRHFRYQGLPKIKKWKIDSTEARAGGSGGQQLTDNNLAVPFRGDIGGGMHPGRKLVVVAIVDSHPDKFYVALTRGRGARGRPPPDVALEMCVRFGGRRQVLRRACVAGVWGRADSDVPFFPFIAGQPFKMEVECESGGFRVFVDAQKLFDFQHRLAPLHSVDTLWIKGSVTITKLG